MGTFFLIFALVVFVVLGCWLSLSYGLFGIVVCSALVVAGIITAIVNAWNRLSKRLDRIEKALGIEEPPEEEAWDGKPEPEDSDVGRDGPIENNR